MSQMLIGRRFLWVWIVVALVTFLRVQNLGATPLFVDEALYCRLGQEFADSFASGLKLSVNHWKVAPLLSIFEGLVLKVVPFKASPIAVCRSVSVVASGLTALTIFYLVRLISKDKVVALIAVLFTLLNPFNFFTDRTALQEPLLTWLITLTTYFGLKSIKEKNYKKVVWSLGVFTLAVLTKLNAFIVVPGLILIAAKIQTTKKELAVAWRFSLLLLFLSLGLVVVIFRLSPLWETVGYHTNRTFSLLELLQRVKINFYLTKSWYQQYLTPLFFVSIFLGGWQMIKDKKLEWLIMPISIICIFIVLVSGFFPRYLLITLPFWAVVVGYSSKQKLGKVVVGLMLVLFMVNDWKIIFKPASATLAKEDYFQFYQDWTSGDGVKSALSYIDLNSASSLVLVPADVIYSFQLQQQSYYPDNEIKFLAISGKEIISNLVKTDVVGDPFLTTTSHHYWLSQLAENDFNLEKVYSTHDQSSKSIHLFKLKPKIQY